MRSMAEEMEELDRNLRGHRHEHVDASQYSQARRPGETEQNAKDGGGEAFFYMSNEELAAT